MNYVLKLDDKQVKKIQRFYSDIQVENKNEYICFFAKNKDFSVSVYTSNKVMFQGSKALDEYNMWLVMLDQKPTLESKLNNVVEDTSHYYKESIGSDEVGTGDYFGPVVVCATYIQAKDIPFLKSLKINDSKKLTDQRIRELGPGLIQKISYSMLALHNEKFNDLTKKGYNMNKLKAYLHNQALISLHKKHKSPPTIVDQFCEPGLYFRYLQDQKVVFKDITFTTKAESKYASVAVASIIARYAFLQYFDQLILDSGYPLLKGASNKVDTLTAQIIKEKGLDFLYKYAKINFVTTQKAQNLLK